MNSETIETLHCMALGLVSTYICKSGAYNEYASTAVHTKEYNCYTRLALKYKTKAIVGYDRQMDLLIKEYE
jgi:hypothetical protein